MTDQPTTSTEQTTDPDQGPPVRSIKGYIVIFGGVLILLALPCFPFIGGIALDVLNSHRERHRLIHETDHRALLEASRVLIRDYAGEHISDVANDPRVPQIIRDLGPSYLYISDEELYVELHGGFDHYGFIAYPAGATERRGDRKLIDGLYYHSE